MLLKYNTMLVLNATFCYFLIVYTLLLSTPDYGLGTVGKCLGPTTSKGPTKDGCKIC